MDRLDSMSVLVAAAEAGSLSAASRRLGTPLATVSRKVSALEAYLGTRLLNRSSRRLTLTEAGRAYVEACKRILDEIGEAEREAAGEYRAARGELAVTAPIVFGHLHVLPVVVDFLAAYPAVDVRLLLADLVVNLFEEPVDLAIRIGPLPDSSLRAIRLGAVRQIVCASPAYLAAHGAPRRPEELAALDCVTFEGLSSPAAWRFGEREVAIRSRLAVTTAEAAITAAIAGLGITRALSYQVAAALAAGQLVPLLQGFEPEPWPVNLVYGGGRLLPQKLRAFLDFAAPRLKARLGEMAGD